MPDHRRRRPLDLLPPVAALAFLAAGAYLAVGALTDAPAVPEGPLAVALAVLGLLVVAAWRRERAPLRAAADRVGDALAEARRQLDEARAAGVELDWRAEAERRRADAHRREGQALGRALADRDEELSAARGEARERAQAAHAAGAELERRVRAGREAAEAALLLIRRQSAEAVEAARRSGERDAATARAAAEEAIEGARREAQDARREAQEALAGARREVEEARREGEEALARAREEAEHELEEARERAHAELEEARERARAELEQARERSRGELEEARERAEARAGEAQETAQREQAELRERLEGQLRRERDAHARAERGRQAEKAWSQELRGQVARLQHDNGLLGDVDDVRALVLRVAMSLLEAEKGLLLAREDTTGDGRLDLVAALGFEADPAHSAVATRFATEVIERDTTIREDSRRAIDDAGDSAADEEIENLVAIPIFIAEEFSGVVVCANREGGFEDYEDDVLVALGDHAGAVLQNGRLQDELRTTYLATVGMLADALQAKDPFLRGHADEVSEYVAAVSQRFGLDPHRREELIFGSLLHDVGKIGISERILLKPGALTPQERAIVELHPRIGCRLVQQIPALRPVAEAILHHHERFDGTGYPARLRGSEIPLEARIVCVADSFSAMTEQRPYRDPMSLEDACRELERCAGTQFDPEVVGVFCEAVRRHGPPEGPGRLAAALDDPELQLRRGADEPLLGHGSLALTDSLTLLHSHRHLHEVAALEARRAALEGRPFAVVLVALTELERVNRERGYAAGDAVLRAVARELQSVAVRLGATACRHGGARLGLVVPGLDEAGAEAIAGQLAETLPGVGRVRVGAATWSAADGEDGEAVVARARSAVRVGPLEPA